MNNHSETTTSLSELDKLDYSIEELIMHYTNLKQKNIALVQELQNLKRSYTALQETHHKVETRVKNLLTRLVALE